MQAHYCERLELCYSGISLQLYERGFKPTPARGQIVHTTMGYLQSAFTSVAKYECTSLKVGPTL